MDDALQRALDRAVRPEVTSADLDATLTRARENLGRLLEESGPSGRLEGNRTEEEAVRLASNTNEDAEAEVEAHRIATNSNETVDRLATNKNETVERLAGNKNETVERLAANTNEETAEDV